METHSKNMGFGGLSRRRCLAIWNSAAWRASKGGKSENSIAWEAVTAGKSENSLAWEAPTGGKSENSLAWGAPTGGESENSLAWGAPTGGGKVKILSLGSPHGGKPPLAPLTDRNKPAVWAATPREAGWITFIYKWNYINIYIYVLSIESIYIIYLYLYIIFLSITGLPVRGVFFCLFHGVLGFLIVRACSSPLTTQGSDIRQSPTE